MSAALPPSRKRKADAPNASPPPLSADALLATSPAAIVSTAAGKLERLRAFCAELSRLTAAVIKANKLARTECHECDEPKEASCRACDDALCGEHGKQCANCGGALCEDCWAECEFEGDCSRGNVVCADTCVLRTRCERDDVGGCEECRDEFDCVDCDQCAAGN